MAGSLPVGGGILDVDPLDAGVARPLTEQVEHSLHVAARALRATASTVPSGWLRTVPDSPSVACVTDHEGAKSDHLHPAVHDGTHAHHRFTHRRPIIGAAARPAQAAAGESSLLPVSLRTSGGISRRFLISTPLNSDSSARIRRCTGASWSRPGRYQLSIRDDVLGILELAHHRRLGDRGRVLGRVVGAAHHPERHLQDVGQHLRLVGDRPAHVLRVARRVAQLVGGEDLEDLAHHRLGGLLAEGRVPVGKPLLAAEVHGEGLDRRSRREGEPQLGKLGLVEGLAAALQVLAQA